MKPKAIIAILLLLLSASADAGPSCNRTYEFIGLTRERSDIFWITSFSDGECQEFQFYSLVISGDSVDQPRSAALASMNVSCARNILMLFEHEEPISIADSTNDWIRLDSSFSIRTPTTPKAIAEDYQTWARALALGAWNWNRRSGSAGIVLPECQGDSLRLIAIDSAGLYLDYTVEKVYYFPASKYLLVFTNNPKYCGEFDSENGFMLMRRKIY